MVDQNALGGLTAQVTELLSNEIRLDAHRQALVRIAAESALEFILDDLTTLVAPGT